MLYPANEDSNAVAQILDLVTREKSKALSAREWKHRLAGYGYSIRETAAGQLVEKLPHRNVICALPQMMTA